MRETQFCSSFKSQFNQTVSKRVQGKLRTQ